jgi:hypothetical protein
MVFLSATVEAQLFKLMDSGKMVFEKRDAGLSCSDALLSGHPYNILPAVSILSSKFVYFKLILLLPYFPFFLF